MNQNGNGYGSGQRPNTPQRQNPYGENRPYSNASPQNHSRDGSRGGTYNPRGTSSQNQRSRPQYGDEYFPPYRDAGSSRGNGMSPAEREQQLQRKRVDDQRIYKSLNRNASRSDRRRKGAVGYTGSASSVTGTYGGDSKFNPGVLLSMFIILLIIGVSLFFIIQSRSGAENPDKNPVEIGNIGGESGDLPGTGSVSDNGTVSDSGAVSGEDDGFTGPPAPAESETETEADPNEGYTLLEVPTVESREGFLILVGSENEYLFPEKNSIKTIYGNKNKSYKVSDTLVSMHEDALEVFNQMMLDFEAATTINDVIVVSGFRDYETQVAVYDDRVATEGEEAAARYVAIPGYSEHHTGLALDLSIYTDEGEMFALNDIDTDGWLTQNCIRYGFILRYPANKTEITGIDYEPWHFRYVGVPHASIMADEGMCLEEYIDYIQTFPYDGEHLLYSDGINAYELYYVAAAEGDVTEIYVPEEYPYEISGDNDGGFVVTVSLPEELANADDTAE